MVKAFGDRRAYPGMILSSSTVGDEVERNAPVSEMPLESDTFTQTRRPRYPFVARAKATDVVSGMQLVGLTTHLSEGRAQEWRNWQTHKP